MKTNKNKMIVGGMLAVLWTASISLSGAAVIITDSFSDPVGPIATGGTITPTSSTGGTFWTVVSGTFATNGTIANAPTGQLGFSPAVDSTIKLDFGNIAPNSSATVEFGLRQYNQAAVSSYFFLATLGDSTSGKSYSVIMRLNPSWYPAVGGGNSGFAIVADGVTTTSGTAGAYIGNTGVNFDTMGISFDPLSGLTVTKNGLTVAAWSGVPTGMNKIDSLTLSNGAAYSGVRLTWIVDNVQVNAQLVPEPSALLLLGIAGFGALVGRRRRKVAA